MKGKYISGFLVVLTFVFSLFGSGGQAFAATGGPSLSKWFYAEADEYGFMRDPDQYSKITAPQWTKLDAFFDTDIPANVGTYDYYHIFDRRTYYNNGAIVSAYDFHFLVRVQKAFNAEPKRSDGRLHMISKNSLDKVPYQYLGYYIGYYDNNIPPAWQDASTSTGLIFTNTADRGDITIFQQVTATTRYDPANPPAYAQPGYTQPTQPSQPDPNDPGNAGLPTRPEPPDDNWDLVGWFKYIVDWIIYIFDSFVWLIAQLGGKIGELVTQSDGMVAMLTSFFSFLPPELTTLMGIGIITIIILTVFRK